MEKQLIYFFKDHLLVKHNTRRRDEQKNFMYANACACMRAYYKIIIIQAK